MTAKQNLHAIQVAMQAAQQGRGLTADEQRALDAYQGWAKDLSAIDPGNYRGGGQGEAVDALADYFSHDEIGAMFQAGVTSYYTPAEIAGAMVEVVQNHAGLPTGSFVLEPSVGTGRFLDFLRGQCEISACETDPAARAILGLRHPDVHTYRTGFEGVAGIQEHMDLVIGNPPFLDQRTEDTYTKLSESSQEAFFFHKSLDSTRPGGLVAMVMPSRFLDREIPGNDKMAAKMDLLAAVRLPNATFKEAGANVMTDVVIAQRRETPRGEDDEAPVWQQRTVTTCPETASEIPLNAVFVTGQGVILGDGAVSMQTSRYGLTPALTGSMPDTDTLTNALTEQVPASVVPPRLDDGLQGQYETVTDPAVHRSAAFIGAYSYAFDCEEPTHGRILQRLPSDDGEAVWAVVDEDFTGRTRERVTALIGLRDLVLDQLALDRGEPIPEAATQDPEANRRELNRAYDAFVKRNGAINSRGNALAMRGDPMYSLLQSLELDYDPGLSKEKARKEGVEPYKPSWKKADLFERSTFVAVKERDHAESPADALAISLAQAGRVDLQRIAGLLSLDGPREALASLDGLVFENPVDGRIETREEYLSGNVRAKLQTARDMHEADPRFETHIEALEAVQPEWVPADQIIIPVGATWVPGYVLTDFIQHLTEGNARIPSHPVNAAGEWFFPDFHAPHSYMVGSYGSDRRPLDDLLPRVVNHRPLTVYDRIDGQPIVNRDETDKAEQAAQAIADAWESWIWQDPERMDELERVYNETVNTHRSRTYDGSFLCPSVHGQFRNQNPAITLETHQVNVAWRMVCSGSTLVDHAVGAGKTMSTVAAVMEMRRMGTTRKPLIVVPNNLIDQWANEFAKLYPGSRVLRATKRDFEKKNRGRFFAMAATCDWDAIIIGESQFAFIRPPKADLEHFLREQVSALSRLEAEAEDKRQSRRVARRRQKIEKQIESHLGGGKPDPSCIDFETLGADALFVDEADTFKNLMFTTNHHNVAGLGPQEGSKKALDFFAKVHYLDRHYGRGVNMLTATPISNSVVELYTQLRYLNWQEMLDGGMADFDSWSALFAEPTTGYEMTATGQFKLRTRFAQYNNVPELLARYRTYADVMLESDLRAQREAEGCKWPVPGMRGGAPIDVYTPRTNGLSAYMEHLLHRASVLQKPDNMLAVTTDARKAALDPRLIDHRVPASEHSKVAIAARNIAAEYHAWSFVSGTQLVFCDFGIHGVFSVYEDLRERLCNEHGIPRAEIEFAQDHKTGNKTAQLHQDVRDGKVRILVGSTSAMGAGMNAQTRLVALHHLDAPWRPRDLQQRDGRGLRQGNMLFDTVGDTFEVAVYRYGTNLTLDAGMWSTLEIKARFTDQIRKGAVTDRVISDVESDADSYASMKAQLSGNPLIKEHFEAQQKVDQLERDERAHRGRVRDARQRAHSLEGAEGRYDAILAGLDNDIATRDGDEGTATVDGQAVAPAEFGTALMEWMNDRLRRGLALPSNRTIGTYRGFEVRYHRGITPRHRFAFKGEGFNYSLVQSDAQYRPTGLQDFPAKAEQVLADLEKTRADTHKARENAITDRARYREQAEVPFLKGEELQEARKRVREIEAELKAQQDKKGDQPKHRERAIMDPEDLAWVPGCADPEEGAETSYSQDPSPEEAARRVAQAMAAQDEGEASEPESESESDSADSEAEVEAAPDAPWSNPEDYQDQAIPVASTEDEDWPRSTEPSHQLTLF